VLRDSWQSNHQQLCLRVIFYSSHKGCWCCHRRTTIRTTRNNGGQWASRYREEFSAVDGVRAEGSWQGDHLQHGLRVTFSAVVGVRAEGFVAGRSPTTLFPLSAVVGVRVECSFAEQSPTTWLPLSAVVGVRAEGFVAEQSPTTLLTCYILFLP